MKSSELLLVRSTIVKNRCVYLFSVFGCKQSESIGLRRTLVLLVIKEICSGGQRSVNRGKGYPFIFTLRIITRDQ